MLPACIRQTDSTPDRTKKRCDDVPWPSSCRPRWSFSLRSPQAHALVDADDHLSMDAARWMGLESESSQSVDEAKGYQDMVHLPRGVTRRGYKLRGGCHGQQGRTWT